MSIRLKIGDYILDAADSGSTSTTTGAKLRIGELSVEGEQSDRGLHTWRVTQTEAEIGFIVVVSGSTIAEVKTRTDAVETAIAQAAGDVVYESAAGTSIKEFKTSNGDWARLSGECQTSHGEFEAHIACALILERGAQAGGGGGLDTDVTQPEGLVGDIETEVEIDTSGLLALVLQARFKDSAGTALTFTSVEDNGAGLARFVFSGSPSLGTLKPGVTLLVDSPSAYAGEHRVTSIDDAGDKITVATAFGATGTGTATLKQTARGNALVWIGNVEFRTDGATAWLPPKEQLRIANKPMVFTDPDTDGASGGEAVARIAFREFPSRLASHAAFSTSDLATRIRQLAYRVALQPATIDARSGSVPGATVTITGSIVTKTEGNSAFDVGDTAPAPLTSAEVTACIDAIREDAFERIGVSSGYQEISRSPDMAGESGEIGFAVSYFVGSAVVIEWDESIVIRGNDLATIDTDKAGKDWVYNHPSVGIVTCEHTLRTVAFQVLQYKGIDGITGNKKWRQIGAESSPPIARSTYSALGGAAATTYEQRFTRSYRLLSAGVAGRQTAAGTVAGSLFEVLRALGNDGGGGIPGFNFGPGEA